MVCKYCGKQLPETPTDKCPHCFATWTPEEVKGRKKPPKTEHETVNGHD